MLVKLPGVRCLRLMHDTTATALEYGIWRSAKKAFDAEKAQRVLFVDVGYSSYQVSVVDYVIGKLTVKSTTYDRTLGGRDFDMRVAEWIASEFRAKHKCDPMSSPKPRMKLLRRRGEGEEDAVAARRRGGEHLLGVFDERFGLQLQAYPGEVRRVGPAVARSVIGPRGRALADSETSIDQLHSVEICGGGSRVASVKRVLATKLNTDQTQPNYGLKTTLNADECTSKGCAMQAAMLSPRFKVKEYNILEATPFGVSLSWDAPSTKPMEGDESDEEVNDSADVLLFPRNGETPSTKRLTFRRGEDFTIKASYADPAQLPEQVSPAIGAFTVKGVPAGSARVVRVNVSHSVHGTVQVASAQLVQEVPDEEPKEDEKMDEGEGKEEKAEEKKRRRRRPRSRSRPRRSASTRRRPSRSRASVARMTRQQLSACLETEAQMANQDRVIRETNDMRNELEAYIYKMRDEVIGDLRPYVSDDAKQKFEAGLNDAETWLYEGDGYDATKSQYAQRLKDVRQVGDAAELRRKADRERPSLVAELQAKVEALKTFCNSTSEEHAHIGDDDRGTVRDAASKASEWLLESLEKQGSLEQCQDPVLLPSHIKDKLYDLDQATRPILTKPKPLPPKAAPPPPRTRRPPRPRRRTATRRWTTPPPRRRTPRRRRPRTPRCPTRPRRTRPRPRRAPFWVHTYCLILAGEGSGAVP